MLLFRAFSVLNKQRQVGLPQLVIPLLKLIQLGWQILIVDDHLCPFLMLFPTRCYNRNA